MLNGISLFTGYAGIDLALKEYVRPILYCDIEKYAQGILLSRMDDGSIPFAPIWNDVTTLDGTQFKGMVDIVYGGFPCQDISAAGKGAGLEGKRSGLFYEVVRICKEASPLFILLENVAAIRTKGSIEIQEELASIGYDTRWCTLSASQVGANHKRERWFCLATNTKGSNDRLSDTRESTGQVQQPRECLSETNVANSECIGTQIQADRELTTVELPRGTSEDWKDSQLPNPNSEGQCGETDASEKEDHKGVWKDNGRSEASPFNSSWWSFESSICRVVDGPAIRLDKIEYVGDRLRHKETHEEITEEDIDKMFRADRIKACGNGVVPLQVKTAFEILMGITGP